MSKTIRLRSRRALILDRALSGGMGKQILIYLIIVVVSFLLLFGFALLIRIPLTSEKTDDFGNFWSMLFFFYDGGLEGTSPDNRWFVYLVNILGSILMGGILIATMTNYLLSNRDKAENGLLRYRLSKHTVFVGYHDAMIPLVRETMDSGTAVILSELPYAEARDKIDAGLDGKCSDRLIVYHGMRTSKEDLESLCLEYADKVFIFPEPSFQDTDSVNLDVVEQIKLICTAKNRADRLKCETIFQHNAVVACFERSNIDEEVNQVLDFTPIILGDTIAQALFSGSVYGNPLSDREPITEDSVKSVHMFIIGLGEIGQAVFTQAVKQLHYPNFDKAKSTITIVEEQEKIDSLKSSYREFFAVEEHSDTFAYLGDFLDISVNSIPQDEIKRFDSSVDEAIYDPNEIVTVVICIEDSATALKKAISLPRSVYDENVPIWLYKSDSDSLVKLIGKEDKAGNKSLYSNITIFGEPEKLLIEDKESLKRAQRINWVYSAFPSVPGHIHSKDEWEKEYISLWDGLSIRDKWSNLNNALSIPVKMRSIKGGEDAGTGRIPEDQLEIFAKVEHNRWVAENLLGGYRPPTFEERQKMTKNRSLKKTYKKSRRIHLDLCRYDELLEDANGIDVRNYDRTIVSNIPLIISQ